MKDVNEREVKEFEKNQRRTCFVKEHIMHSGKGPNMFNKFAIEPPIEVKNCLKRKFFKDERERRRITKNIPA